MKTEETTISYYKANDNHVYKMLKNGHVLHVNYGIACMNILSPGVWEDILDSNSRAHTSLTPITKEEFDQKAKSAMTEITNNLYQ